MHSAKLLATCRIFVLATAGLIGATACASNVSGSGVTSTGGTSSGVPTGTGAAGKVVVTEKEFSLHLSRNTFTAGRYTFTVDNIGKVPHALAVSGPGVRTARTPVLSPGGTADLTLALQPGTYDLWCPVDGHRRLGMGTRIRVSGAGTAPGGSSAG